MQALNRIDRRLDHLETSVGNLQKVIWTAAGIVIAVGIISTFLFGLGDLLTKIPFEVTIRNQPSP